MMTAAVGVSSTFPVLSPFFHRRTLTARLFFRSRLWHNYRFRLETRRAEKGEAMQEITATELKERLESGDEIQLIDVRNPDEFAFAKIEGARLIPFGEVMARTEEFASEKDIVVMCRSGVRSARVIEFLESRGHEGKLYNLIGGILAWSDEVDPSVPKY